MTTIDITQGQSSGTCDFKCSFEIDTYNLMSNITCSHLQHSIDVNMSNSASHAKFNQQKFTVKRMEIYSPSQLTYNGIPSPGEIMISHEGGNPSQVLLIFLPLQVVTNAPNALPTTIVTNLITVTNEFAPQINESTTQGIDPFNVKDLLPLKPFYYIDLHHGSAIISFANSSAIPISQDTFSILQNLVTPNPQLKFRISDNETIKIFLNQKGPQVFSPANENNIFIDCQPTDASEEEMNLESNNKSNEIKFNWKDIANNSNFVVFFSIFVFVIVLLIIHNTMKYIKVIV
jgi:hypothetical protein